MKNEFNDLLNMVNSLSEEEKQALIDKVMDMMQKPAKRNAVNCNEAISSQVLADSIPDCPHCHAKHSLGFVVKRGKENGTQRYYCKSCRRSFVATTSTAFERSRKDFETWNKFIELTISGCSLKKCAATCKIAYQTAFIWRHKILNAFRVHQESMSMSGKIQLDEMLIPISYKGNHIKGGFDEKRKAFYGYDNGLPRKSFKRGTDNKSTSSKDKACVFCMIKNGNEAFYASVPGVGFMQNNMLDKTIGKHVKKETSLILADQYKVTERYLINNDYDYVVLAGNTSDNYHDHKPEIRDGNHLQHVNALHMHIRRFLSTYCGVSTKFLENYVSLYIWLKNVAANKAEKRIQKASVSLIGSSDCYISKENIKAMPAVPMCA